MSQGFVQAVGSPRTREGLGAELDRLVGRLGEIRDRLDQLSDRLIHPEPRPAEPPGGIPASTVFESSINLAHDIASGIDSILQRLHSRI